MTQVQNKDYMTYDEFQDGSRTGTMRPFTQMDSNNRLNIINAQAQKVLIQSIKQKPRRSIGARPYKESNIKSNKNKAISTRPKVELYRTDSQRNIKTISTTFKTKHKKHTASTPKIGFQNEYTPSLNQRIQSIESNLKPYETMKSPLDKYNYELVFGGSLGSTVHNQNINEDKGLAKRPKSKRIHKSASVKTSLHKKRLVLKSQNMKRGQRIVPEFGNTFKQSLRL